MTNRIMALCPTFNLAADMQSRREEHRGVLRLHVEQGGNEICGVYGNFIFLLPQWIVVSHRMVLHLSSVLQRPDFVHAFTRKGRFKDVMERTPVHVITARAALIGAASYGLESLKNHNG